jgi:plastocyanin
VKSNATYPQLTFSPLPAASSGSETITLNATAPAGLTVVLSSNTVKLDTANQASLGITIGAGQSMDPGDYKVTIGYHYGGVSKTTNINVKVVQYLVLESINSFSPSSLTVNQGSTVYWINLDSPSRFDREIHNVVFISGDTNVKSSDMAQFQTFSHTFTAPGTYSYVCSYHPPGMKGVVNVTP